MIILANKYGIHILLFVIAVVTYLSINYTISDNDDYCYYFGAVNILQNHTYLCNGDPPRAPMGYSLLIVPFFYLFGITVQSAVYPCAILGALTVVILYQFTKDLLDRRAALFASLFLIFSFHWSRSLVVMSDVPALFFMLLSIFAIVKYIKSKKSFFIYLFYLAIGFACLIRYMSVLVFVVIGLYILLSKKTQLLKQKEVWFGIPLFLIILSPQLIYNIYFGSLFTTGYHGLKIFALEYFWTSGDQRPPFQIILYIKYLIAGFGTPLLPFFLYGTWDWIKKRKHEELSLILPWIAVPLVAMSFYYWPKHRLIIFIFPALLILSGHGFSKTGDSSIIKRKMTKKVLNVLLILTFLTPTAIFWFEIIQRRAARHRCQRETFVWIRENSGDDDIIISHSNLSFEYYSQRKVYSLDTPHNELEKLISTHNNIYLVIHEVWRSQKFIKYMIDAEQWLNETYGLIHLKTFENKPTLFSTSKLLYSLSRKVSIPSFPTKDRWDVYLIAKN